MYATWLWCLLPVHVVMGQAALEIPALSGGGQAASAIAVTNQPGTNVVNEAARVLSLSELAQASQSAIESLDSFSAKLTVTPATLNTLQTKLEAWQNSIPRGVRSAHEEMSRASSVLSLEEVRNIWLTDQSDLKEAVNQLGAYARSVSEDVRKLDALRGLWQRTYESFNQETPPTASEQVRQMVERISLVLRQFRARENEVISMQTKAAELLAMVDDLIREIQVAQINMEKRLLLFDVKPLWTELAQEDFSFKIETIGQEWNLRMEALRLYVVKNQVRFLVQVTVLLVAMVVVFFLRRSVLTLDLKEDEKLGVTLLQQRPVSVALVIMLSLNYFIHPHPVTGYRMLIAPILVVILVRLVSLVVGEMGRRGIWVVSIFFLSEIVRPMLWAAPMLERLFLLAEASAAMLVLLLFPTTGLTDVKSHKFWRWIRRVLAGQLGMAVLCLVFGAMALGRLLAAASIFVMFLAYAYLAMYRVLGAMVPIILHTPLVRRLNLVRNNPATVQNHLIHGLRLLTLFLFISTTLFAYQVRDMVVRGLKVILTSPLTVGNLSVSLGDVLAFGLVIWLALKISQLIRFIFQEDLVPRLRLPQGVPYAASTAIHYAVLFVGFLIAIMAAGVDMGRFAIIGGAFGVGIGFGLQNIVNNFVSGLILLFERPIKIGDRIELDTVIGTVQRIGIRSSTVRTFDGAEVIVPNSDLISNKVTNWTLTDLRRRIIISIGVKYGTDPERMLELLRKVADEHGEILKFPKAEAIFRAHGESSLDFELRVWTDSSEWMRIHSELTTRINRVLAANNIEIPFPQRDLHLRSSEVPLFPPGPNPPHSA